MAGTVQGGLSAAETNKRKYGDNFYARIGAIGGAKSRNGGFASKAVGADGLTGKQRAAVAGRVGGIKSRRTKKTETVR